MNVIVYWQHKQKVLWKWSTLNEILIVTECLNCSCTRSHFYVATRSQSCCTSRTTAQWSRWVQVGPRSGPGEGPAEAFVWLVSCVNNCSWTLSLPLAGGGKEHTRFNLRLCEVNTRLKYLLPFFLNQDTFRKVKWSEARDTIDYTSHYQVSPPPHPPWRLVRRAARGDIVQTCFFWEGATWPGKSMGVWSTQWGRGVVLGAKVTRRAR